MESRQHWISVLSRSNTDELNAYWSGIEQPAFTMVREPQVALVMLRGRSGGTGEQFNVGEATVTRCSVALDNDVLGHGYVLGRDREHARLAAVFDALMQRDSEAHQPFIDQLAENQAQKRRQRAEKIAATRVNFYTMETEEMEE